MTRGCSGTVAAIEEDLMQDGLLLRYRSETGVDGLAGGEHPFLACSFWLVEQYAASGLIAEARALHGTARHPRQRRRPAQRGVRPERRRQMGNVPQALSHLTLVRAADAIAAAERGREDRLPYVRGESEGEQAEVTEREDGRSRRPRRRSPTRAATRTSAPSRARLGPMPRAVSRSPDSAGEQPG